MDTVKRPRAEPRRANLMRWPAGGFIVSAVVMLVVACSTEQTAEPRQARPSQTTTPSASPTPNLPPTPRAVDPDALDLATATGAVQHLAGAIGPRMSTGPRFRTAQRWVASQLRTYGYDVRREGFAVPAGTSWGVPVTAGRSSNLIATAPGLDRNRPHLIVGAHLDTVPQAPGAEDNASGVGVLLAVAEAASGRATRLPTVFVLFGAEEPRGPGDNDHHYGSRHHVAALRPAERKALRGMVSLDRVGVGEVLPVCSAGAPDRQRARMLRAARGAGVEATPCRDNRASDHWSFVRAGLPGTRLGSTPYAAYHSEDDLPAVVNRAQLRRAARTTLAWLSEG